MGRFLIFLTLFLSTGKTFAQSDSTLTPIQNLPVKYLETISSKADKYYSEITSKTEKTLEKLAKWEEKIKSILEKWSNNVLIITSKISGGQKFCRKAHCTG